MKEIKSDGIFEKKIRIYQTFKLEELNEFYQKHKKEYKNINQLFVSLIFSGLEKEKLMDENASEYYYQSQDMQTNLADIQRHISAITQNNFNSYKDLLGLLYQNQTLLCRIYNAMFKLSENVKLNKQFFDLGMYDDLPNEFENVKEKIDDILDVELGTSPKNLC